MSDRRLAQKGARPAALPMGKVPAAPAKRRTALDIDALHGHFGYFIRRLQVWVFQDFIRTLAPIDIRPAQYSVLIVIAANPGINQLTIAAALDIERAGLGRLVDRLVQQGLVTRIASVVHRRYYALHLTAAGRKLLDRDFSRTPMTSR